MATLIWLIALIAVAGIVWWFVQQVALPRPIELAAYAILAIVAIVMVVKLLIGSVGMPPGL